jgi:hypothetical protein
VVAAATCAATGAATLALAIGSSSAATQVDPASRAIAYLQAEQSASDGSIPVGASTDTVSEEYAIGAAAAGYDPSALRQGSGPSVMTYLSRHAASACATAGACGELIQAVVAAGLDPSSFGGVDLLTTLDGFYDTATGVFGDGEAFTQALAVQGLVAAAQAVPAAAVHRLVSAQDSDGGWDFLLIKNDPNAATDFDSSDTNSTAMVLMALDAAGVHARDHAALAWLHIQQDADGGFPYQAGFGTDPDSTALVLQGLLAAGQNPNATAWAVGGHTPLATLIATQAPGGGYAFPGNPAPDPFTTAQVPPALERAAYPLACGVAPCFQTGATLAGPPPPPPTATPAPTSPPRPTSPTSTSATPSAAPVASSPTSSVLGSTATPSLPPATPAPAATTPPVNSPGSPPIAATGFPVAAVYLLAGLAAAVIVAAIALGVRRVRGR